MAALGLAAMGNLNGDRRLQLLSKTQYGEALVKTNKALQDPVKNLETAIRTTVMLALFQVIRVFICPICAPRPQCHQVEPRLTMGGTCPFDV